MIYEKLSIDKRKELQKRSMQKFAEIYKKTLAAYGLTAKQAPCSKGFQRCWNDILKIWETQSSATGYDVIYLALYHIAWNIYPVSSLSPAQLELLPLVEQVLIDKGYAFEVLSESYLFNRALDLIWKSTYLGSPSCLCHTAWFGKYIYANTCRKIILKNGKNALSQSRVWQIGRNVFYCSSRAQNIVMVFETAIKRLVPSATSWTRTEWSDENYILQALNNVHGVTYAQHYAEFDALLNVFDSLLNGYSYDRDLMLLAQFPASMAACMWPKDTEKKVAQFFIRICKRAGKQLRANPRTKSAFRKAVITKSWVYQQYEAGVWPTTTEIKKQKFELLLGI